MRETWRKWRYPHHEKRAIEADDFALFEAWFQGPWTPAIAAKMPIEKLVLGPGGGGINDPQTQRVVDHELAQRQRQDGWMLLATLCSVLIAALALIWH